MNIDHIALWSPDIERLCEFYSKWFNCTVSDRYDNEKKKFSSYFLSLSEGARIEIMQRSDISKVIDQEVIGISHFAVRLESAEQVNDLTDRLREAGIIILSDPRTTGDGYYESVILDPDGNRIELTAY